MSDKIRLRRDTFAGFPRLTFINPADGGDHVQWNKRFRQRDSWANLEVTINTNAHKEPGGWVSFTASEGHTTEGGNTTSRTISMTLNQARARELYEALDEVFGKRTNPAEG